MEPKKIISDEQGVKLEEETKTRKGSTTTTIKSFNGVVEKLKELKMTNEEEDKKLREIKQIITERWLAIEMGITVERIPIKSTENIK